MMVQSNLNAVRAAIKQDLGVDQLRALHRENSWLDAAGVAAYWGAVATLFSLLTFLPFGIRWCMAFIAQGFALQCLGLLSHDAFIHRKIWGDRFSWLGAIVSSIPVLLCPTWYLISHRDHHTFLGTDQDTETYKETLDAIWKRICFLTLPGDRLARLGHFAKAGHAMPVIRATTPKERRRLTTERALLCGFTLAVAAVAVLWPRVVLAGYILPLCIVTPIASTIRVILEHADANPANRFHLGTYYRTGTLTRFLFVADSGDCHLIHHIFSQIPWYRMAAATRLMRPFLIANGVIERDSLAQLAAGWFFRGFPHRSLWFSGRPNSATPSEPFDVPIKDRPSG